MLAVQGIRKTFHPGTVNEVRALQGVDLALDEGSFVIVLGLNGSGKSTLLNAIAGTFPLDEGSITLGGHDITRWPEHKRARYIGRVFQNPFSGTAPNMSIPENFALAAHRGRPRGLNWALNRRLLDIVPGPSRPEKWINCRLDRDAWQLARAIDAIFADEKCVGSCPLRGDHGVL